MDGRSPPGQRRKRRRRPMVRQAMLTRRTITSSSIIINRDNPRIYRTSLIYIPSRRRVTMKNPTTEMFLLIGHRRRQTSPCGYTKCTSNRNRSIRPSTSIYPLRSSTTWWQPLASQPLLSRRPPPFPQYQNFQQHQPHIFLMHTTTTTTHRRPRLMNTI